MAVTFNPPTNTNPAPGKPQPPGGYAGVPVPAPPPSSGKGTPDQNDAYATLKSTLDLYGLGSLADWAWGEIIAGKPDSQILLDLQQTAEFKQRFPAIDQRLKAGLPALSPAEYIAYENQARQMFRAAGFPPSFYDQTDDFTKYLVDDVSVAELAQRTQLYVDAAFNVPAEDRAALKNLYGIDEGGIAAYFADPDRALPLLQQQSRAAGEYGAAARQHFGPLTAAEAERLASLGLSPDQAAQGFGQVYHAAELFKQLPGENPNGLDRQTALGVVTGDQASIEALQRQADRRKAQFEGGGDFATGKTGYSGLGSAATS